MKLTKKLEKELLQIYHAYWNSYLEGDMGTFSDLLDEHCHIIGSTAFDVFNDRQSAVAFYSATAKQISGKAEFRNRKIVLLPSGNHVMVQEEADFYFLTGGDWHFYGHMRLSTLLAKKEAGWKIIHQHGSMPDAKAVQGEQNGLEKITKENLELRNAVQRRTVELEYKNQELEIEGALEKVRSSTMAMQKSEELKDIINVVYEQLVYLKIPVEHAGFIMDYKERDDMHIWLADHHLVPSQITIPYFDSPHWNSFREAKETGLNFFGNQLNFEEKNKFYRDLFQLFPVPDEAKEYYFTCPGLAISTVLLDNVGLYIENFSAIPYTDEQNNTLMRFGNVFQQTYTRFSDLQKAEAQTREAKIEAALERIRSRSLAMHQSGELKEVMSVMFQQLTGLEVLLGTVAIQVFDPVTKDCTFWVGNDKQDAAMVKLPYDKKIISEDNYMRDYWQARNSGESFFNKFYSFEQKNAYFRYVFENNDEDTIPPHVRAFILQAPSHINTLIIEKNSALFADNYDNQFYTEDNITVLKRTAKVFDQAYVRFLDLQKAEAQIRESQIELSLERVRAKTMAMQHSDELAEASFLLDSQVRALGIKTRGCAFNIYGENESTEWFSSEAGTMPVYKTPRENLFLRYYEEGQTGKPIHIETFSGATCAAHYDYLCTVPVMGASLRKIKEDGGSFPALQIDHVTYFKYGYLLFITLESIPEAHEIFKRFAKVFEQTYTRFLDLQKAEAQTRESQIELSLERVRAKTMAMHNSTDVGETAAVMVDELKRLGVETIRCGIGIMHEPGDMEVWTIQTDENDKTAIIIGWLDMHMHPLLHGAFESWRKKSESYSYELKDEDLLNYYNAINHYPGYPIRYDTRFLPAFIHHNEFHFAEGTLFAFSLEQLLPEQRKIFKRFAGVFGQTYRRYLDLKKAEAQARESQIELSLERVRARAMAMQKSAELADLVHTVFKELTKLDFLLNRCIIMIYDPVTNGSTWWMANSEPGSVPLGVFVKYHEYIPYLAYLNAWKARTLHWEYLLEGTNKKEWDAFIFTQTDMSLLPEAVKTGMRSVDRICLNASFNNFGSLTLASLDPLTPAHFDILLRFAKVFDLTYTRFNDLQKAEAQTKEAKIEASLERVRANTMAMYHSNELAGTASLLFRQIKELGFELWSCGFCIWKENDCAELWMNNDSGGLLPPMMIPYKDEPTHRKIYEASLRGETVHEYVWEGEALEEHYTFLQTIPSVKNAIDILKESGLLLPAKQCYYVGFFKHGYLLLISKEPAMAASDLTSRFAKVFDQTYTRFLDLQKVEALAVQAAEDLIKLQTEKKRAEDALTELRETQKQLIQSEKMASLGELTAGIAHEIQNPLNFVNNFSEVSNELIEELKGERLKVAGERNIQLEEELLKDLEQNLEKINHHGKRADAIVKGMLQHSRSTGTVKEPTNINTLADEYIRLCYHGLRAKDKLFNAAIHTDFDASIEKINIIPQDIGRVVLNVMTNAFYAVTERKKMNIAGYEPAVSAGTLKLGDSIELRIKDNGGGIPQNIIDKIFQPFFTTKPTGQGTGLGLSLAYDIVKAHGGEIRVVSKADEGSTFIIQLPIA